MRLYPVHPYAEFKTDTIATRTKYLCDQAQEVFYEMAEYCEDRKLPFVVTDSVSTMEEDRALSRVSDEHSQGRAFDISIRNWPQIALDDFVKFFEARFISVAAIGKKSGQARLIFMHNSGFGVHMHVQVNRLFGMKYPLSRTIV